MARTHQWKWSDVCHPTKHISKKEGWVCQGFVLKLVVSWFFQEVIWLWRIALPVWTSSHCGKCFQKEALLSCWQNAASDTKYPLPSPKPNFLFVFMSFSPRQSTDDAAGTHNWLIFLIINYFRVNYSNCGQYCLWGAQQSSKMFIATPFSLHFLSSNCIKHPFPLMVQVW